MRKGHNLDLGYKEEARASPVRNVKPRLRAHYEDQKSSPDSSPGAARAGVSRCLRSQMAWLSRQHHAAAWIA